MQTVAIDLGFGWLKAAGPDRQVRIPAVTGPSRQLFDAPPDADPLDHLVHLEEGVSTFVGSLVIRQSETALHTLRPDRATAPGARVLFRAGLALVADSGPARVVTGLPVAWYWKQKADMERLAAGRHEIELRAGRELIRRTISVAAERVVPQPYGAAMAWLLDDDGDIVRRREAAGTIGVVDIGFNTLDLLYLDKLEIIQRYSSTRLSGMHVALNALTDAGATEPLYQLDHVAARHYPQAWRQARAHLAAQIAAEVETCWPVWPDVVLLSGGGAAALEEFLHLPRAQVVGDPATANVRGYLRLGRRAYRDSGGQAEGEAGRRPHSVATGD